MTNLRTRWRALTATPGMLLTAVVTLGVGIGLNATLFAIMFSGSSDPIQRGLLRARKTDASGHSVVTPNRDAYPLAAHSEWFRDVFAQARWETRLGLNPVRGLVVTENYFLALGVRTALNVNPPPAQLPEIVLSQRAALSLFSWPFAPVGRIVDLDGCRVRIAGTAPASFTGAEPAPSDFWIFEQSAKQCASAPVGAWTDVIALLRPGIDPPHSMASDAGGMFVFEEVPGVSRLTGARKDNISPLAFAFILCLTIPCINVANLMLARSLSKQREVGIRLALGASRRQIAGLVIGDGIAIGILGAIIAFPLAWIGVRFVEVLTFISATELIAAGLRSNMPLTRLDPTVFATCLASGIAAAILFSFGPALRASAQPINESLRGEIAGMRIPRLLKSMTLIQTSFCALVIAISAALLWNVHELARVDPGYKSQGVVTIDGASDVVAAKRSLDNQPWVASAAFSSDPLNIAVTSGGTDALTTVISPGYFNTLGINLREGRDFTTDEVNNSTGVALISAATAQAWWPGADPIGKSFDLDPFDLRNAQLPADEDHRHVKVIGVAADVVTARLWNGVDRYRVYLPGVRTEHPQQLLVRSPSPIDTASIGRVTAFLTRQTPGEHLLIMPLDQKIASDRYLARGIANISVALGALMLVLALSGMYSMLALTTELRMKEFAIRAAIGATPRSLFGSVTGSASLLAMGGGLIGTLLFVALDLFELPQLEFPLRGSRLIVYVAVPIVMLAVGLVSAFAPGLRASRTEVTTLLRESAG